MSEKAGPDLDARLAELMGLEVCSDVDCGGCDSAMYLTESGWEYGERDGRPYSTDISAAVSAAEEMRKAGRIKWWSLNSPTPESPFWNGRAGTGAFDREFWSMGWRDVGDPAAGATALTMALMAALSAEPVESMKGGAR